jgi:O-antigen ligase
MYRALEILAFSPFFVFSFLKLYVDDLIESDTLTFVYYGLLLSLTLVGFIASEKRKTSQLISVFLLSLAWCTLVGAIGANFDTVYFSKLQALFLSLLTVPVASYMLRRDLLPIAIAFSALAIFLITFLFSSYASYDEYEVGYVLNNVYLHASFLCGFFILACVLTKRFYFLVFPLLGCLIVLGGRGPLMALMVVAAISLLIFYGKRLGRTFRSRNGLFFIVVLPIGLISAYYLVPDLFDRSFARWQSFWVESGGGSSALRRLLHLDASVSALLSSPFIGIGTANYGLFLEGFPVYAYPHNFILELSVESGMLGAIPVFACVGVLFLKSMRNATWPIMLYVLLVMQLSYSYADLNEFYFAIALVVLYREIHERRNENIGNYSRPSIRRY